jgi:hypothetical protein
LRSQKFQKDFCVRHFFKHFMQSASGAVTVDWVVLTAAVVGLGILAAVNIAGGTVEMGSGIDAYLLTEQPFAQNE